MTIDVATRKIIDLRVAVDAAGLIADDGMLYPINRIPDGVIRGDLTLVRFELIEGVDKTVSFSLSERDGLEFLVTNAVVAETGEIMAYADDGKFIASDWTEFDRSQGKVSVRVDMDSYVLRADLGTDDTKTYKAALVLTPEGTCQHVTLWQGEIKVRNDVYRFGQGGSPIVLNPPCLNSSSSSSQSSTTQERSSSSLSSDSESLTTSSSSSPSSSNSSSSTSSQTISTSSSSTESSAGVVISGTITTAIESEIVAGGLTIILTLHSDTWESVIGGNNSKTDALIAAFVGDDTTGGGWNDQVTPVVDYLDIVRDSSTQVTITLPASSYAIIADETVTLTVPATCVAGGVDLPPKQFLVAEGAEQKLLTENGQELLTEAGVNLIIE